MMLPDGPNQSSRTNRVPPTASDAGPAATDRVTELANELSNLLDGSLRWLSLAARTLPTGEPMRHTTWEDEPVDITLRAFDPDGDTLEWRVSTPSRGILSGRPPNLVYTPAPDAHGQVAFTWTARDRAATTGISRNPGCV